MRAAAGLERRIFVEGRESGYTGRGVAADFAPGGVLRESDPIRVAVSEDAQDCFFGESAGYDRRICAFGDCRRGLGCGWQAKAPAPRLEQLAGFFEVQARIAGIHL